jgi:hypothetical protein
MNCVISLACPLRTEVFPSSIVIDHGHIASHGKGAPVIVEPHLTVVGSQNGLATGLVFEWCDGFATTIAEATLRTVQRQVQIKPLVLKLVEEGRSRGGGDEEMFVDVLDDLASQQGALLVNHGGLDLMANEGK